MKLYLILFSICGMMFAQNVDITGHWKGVLNAGAQTLRITFEFAKDDQGKLTGKMGSPDQMAKMLPCDSVDFSKNILTITITIGNGIVKYSGPYKKEKQIH